MLQDVAINQMVADLALKDKITTAANIAETQKLILDAVEKNPNVDGSLASLIQANTDAINELNKNLSTVSTNLTNVNTNHSHHWTFGYNNANKINNFYVHFKFRGGDKGSILMCLLGSNSGSGTVKVYLPIKSEILQNRINGSTIKNYSTSAGFEGQVIQTGSDGTYILVVTNVEAYAMVEMMSSNCEILNSYFA